MLGRAIWVLALAAITLAACGSDDDDAPTTTAGVGERNAVAVEVAAGYCSFDAALSATRGPCPPSGATAAAMAACKGPELVAVAAAEALLKRLATLPDTPSLRDVLAPLSRGLQAFVSAARERISAIDAGDTARFDRDHESIAGALGILCPVVTELVAALPAGGRDLPTTCDDTAVG
ncbi:MAG: hypothetical protein QOD30_327 [Actinomycetota bacterium]|jgi:hypothetical protein|nr:hypothetical protein [Actinomycetota bacterium]